MSIDRAFGYTSPETRALSAIDSTKYPDTNKDFQENLIRLNQFVDYIAAYIGQMQKGIDKNNQDIVGQIQGTISDVVVLLGGGELLYGINLGDLQYFLPAIGALLGFDTTTPFPINLFNAAEHFFLGYVVPLDSFGTVIEGIIDGWAAALGIDPAFIQSINDLLDAFSAITGDLQDLLTSVEDLLNIIGPTSGFGQIWHTITTLLGGFDLKTLGGIVDPFFKAAAPWIEELAVLLNNVDQIIKAFTAGTTDLQGILNFASIFTSFTNFLPGGTFNPAAAISQWVTGALAPTNLLAMLVPNPNMSAGVVGFIPLENLAMEAISVIVGGAQSVIDAILTVVGFPTGSGTPTDITHFFTDFLGMFANPALTSGGFNPSTAVSNFITTMINPLNLLGPMNPLTQLLNAVNIPGLDATKIISGIFGTGLIPGLDASKIISGTFLAGLIPGLDASKIISGVFGLSFLPSVQQIIDYIYQAMFGGTSTGNPISSVLTALKNIPGVNIISTLLASVIPGLDATKIISGLFGLAQIPSLPASQITSGTFLASLIPGLDATKIISGILSIAQIPTGSLGAGNISDIQHIIDYIFQAVHTGSSATGNPVTSVLTSLQNIPGVNIISTLLASVIPGLDATKIISGILSLAQIPNLPAGQITSGTFFASLIPGLDASKIISGTFALGFLPSVQTLIDYAFQAMNGGTSTGNAITTFKTSLLNIPGVNIISTLLASVIPGLDATKIISGVFGTGLIPGLDASKIISGIFGAGLIPGLDASKITSGTFGLSFLPSVQTLIDYAYQAMFGGSSTGNAITTFKTALLNIPGVNIISTLLASVIPGLDATKIISGILALAQIPNLPAGQITSGTFLSSLIPGLDATKIISGIFSTGQIPGLDASKIISGIFPVGLIPGLDASQIISGQFSQWILPLLPVGSIGQTTPNLLANPNYAGSSSVSAGATWAWDSTVTHTADGSGSVKVTANGTGLQLLSDPPTPVSQGQTLNMSHWLQWSGVTASGPSLALAVVTYLGTSIVNSVTLQTISSPAASGSWQQLSGTYTVPSGVDNVRLQLNVYAAATAGSIWWDDASLTKTQLLAESWTAGLSGDLSNLNTAVLARALQTDVMSLVNNLGLGSFSSVNGGLTSISNRLFGLGSGGLFDASMLGNIANIPQLLVGSVAGIGGIANIGSALQQTWDAVSGLSAGSGTLNGILARLVNLTTGGLFNAAQLSNIANIPLLSAGSIPGLDATKIITGILAIAQIPTASLGKSNIADLQSVIDGTTNNLGGYSVPLTGTTQSLANTAMDTIFQTVISNAQQLSQLTQVSSGNANSGMSANINFANYANSSVLPAAFTTTYLGSGTSTLGISGGLAHWNVVADAARSAKAIYNIGPTLSDYQLVGATPNSGPAYNYNSSQSGANYQIARSDLAGNNYVYSKFTSSGPLSYNVELGTIVAGVKTVFVAPTAVTSNAAIWLVAGTPTSPRQFQILSGSTPIITYTDAGNVSQMGANYRYWGFGGDVAVSGSNTAAPGDGAAVSVADHQPPSTIGSFFRQYRAGTGTVSVNSGFSLCPGSFFDTVDRVTADFAFNASTNALTIGYEGTYYCNLRYSIANLPGNTKFDPTLYQNSAMVRRGNGAFADGSFSANSPSGIGTGFVVYCKAGDVLQPGFWASTSMSGLLTGETTGTASYFEVGLLNRSLA